MRQNSRLAKGLVALGASVAVVVAGPVATASTVESQLVFSPENPTYDPGNTQGPDGASELLGEVSVRGGGYLDFHGRSVVRTPDRPNLHPGTAPFAFGALINLNRGVGFWNIMQKGYWRDSQFKLSLHPFDSGTRLSCRVSGSEGALKVFSAPDVIAPGGWYSVGCRRYGDTVEVVVNGEVVGRGTGSTGVVSSEKPYLIGSKGMQAEDPDQFLGLLDNAYVSVASAGA